MALNTALELLPNYRPVTYVRMACTATEAGACYCGTYSEKVVLHPVAPKPQPICETCYGALMAVFRGLRRYEELDYAVADLIKRGSWIKGMSPAAISSSRVTRDGGAAKAAMHIFRKPERTAIAKMSLICKTCSGPADVSTNGECEKCAATPKRFRTMEMKPEDLAAASAIRSDQCPGCMMMVRVEEFRGKTRCPDCESGVTARAWAEVSKLSRDGITVEMHVSNVMVAWCIGGPLSAKNPQPEKWNLLKRFAICSPDPADWPSQGRELFDEVHRRRELLRSLGDEI